MNLPIFSEHKKEFQLERIILFSDAVFAIAITLLVIELKVPEVSRPITEQKVVQGLADILPKFIGFLVSFFLIGLYWTVHHRMFGFVVHYTQRLLWLNLLFLLGIVLMPFSTAFYSEYIFEYLKAPVVLYAFNICFIGIMNYMLWKYVSNPRSNLSDNLSKALVGYYSFRALTVPVIFAIMVIAYLYFPQYAIFIPPFIPLIMWIVGKAYKKKLLNK